MTLTAPVAGAPVAAGVDPFGFWQAPAGPAAFALDEDAAAVWSLDLAGDDGAAALAERERQLAAVEQGIAQAGPRLDAFLARRAAARRGELPAFAAGEEAPAERALAEALDGLERPPAAFAPGEAPAGPAGWLDPNRWEELRVQLAGLLDSINRHVIHFVWVDTTIDVQVAARTTLAWSGDLATRYWSGLSRGQVDAHRRSLELACAARAAQVKALLAAAQLAARITLAVTTPLGPLHALALAWHFLRAVIIPLMHTES